MSLAAGLLNFTRTLTGLFKNIRKKYRPYKLMFTPNQLLIHDSFLKEILRCVWNHIQFLRPCSVIFLLVILTEKRSFAKCQTASPTNTTGFFSSFMCLTNCNTFSMPHLSFFHLAKRKQFYIF